jgi:hypothetical protein
MRDNPVCVREWILVMRHDVGVFCTGDKGTCIYGTCTSTGSWEEHYRGDFAGASSKLEHKKKTIEVRVEAYMPRVRVTRYRLCTRGNWKVGRCRAPSPCRKIPDLLQDKVCAERTLVRQI